VAGLLLIALTVVAFNLCYGIDDIAAYFLAAWLVAAAMTAVALDALRGYLPASWPRSSLTVGACALLAGQPLL
jgi:hypothetical protein